MSCQKNNYRMLIAWENRLDSYSFESRLGRVESIAHENEEPTVTKHCSSQSETSVRTIGYVWKPFESFMFASIQDTCTLYE